MTHYRPYFNWAIVLTNVMPLVLGAEIVWASLCTTTWFTLYVQQGKVQKSWMERWTDWRVG